MDLSRRNTHQADARTRTGDPFITSELRRSGGVCRRVAGSGLEAGETPRRRSVSPPCSVSRFPGVWARIGHSGKTGARLRSPHAVGTTGRSSSGPTTRPTADGRNRRRTASPARGQCAFGPASSAGRKWADRVTALSRRRLTFTRRFGWSRRRRTSPTDSAAGARSS